MRKLCKLLTPFIIPILAIVLLSLLYLGILEKINVNPMVSFLVESIGYIILVLLFFLLYHRLYPKLFATRMPFKFKLPKVSTMLGIALIVPGVWFLRDELLLRMETLLGNPVIQDTADQESLGFIIAYSLHAVFLAPAFEEFGFRVLTISPFKSKRGKIYAVIISAFIFGVLHGSADSPEVKIRVFISGIVYSVLLLCTNNYFYPMFVHAMSNAVASVAAILLTINTNIGANYIFISSTSHFRISSIVLCLLLGGSVAGLAIIVRNVYKQKNMCTARVDNQN